MGESRTERLLLRQWRDEDLDPFAALNADPETMRFFPAPTSREESDALAGRARRQIEGGLAIVGGQGRRRGELHATEAGRAALAHGFDEPGLDEIVSFTSRLNEPSWRVMERLGMSRDPADDFDHPRLPVGHPLRPHVLSRIS